MPFLLISSDFGDDPRVMALTMPARLLLVELGCYCARRQTDGHFTIEAVAIAAAGAKIPDASGLLEELRQTSPITGTALVERTPAGFRLVDYLNRERESIFRQQSRDEIAANRARDLAKKNVKRGKAPRVSPGDRTGDRSGDNTGDNRGVSPGDPTRGTRPVPVPVPVPRTPEISISRTPTQAGTPRARGGTRETPQSGLRRRSNDQVALPLDIGAQMQSMPPAVARGLEARGLVSKELAQ